MPDDPLWIAVPATDPITATTHGEHKIEFVSRHAIAETGLICPSCHNEIASIGDYIMVRHCRLGDVIKCNGTRHIQDEETPCGMFLVASPDTEHGDHILYDRVPQDDRFELFYRFVRISEGDAAKRKYGEDLKLVDGQMVAVPTEPAPPKPVRPKLSYKAGQIWQTDDERQIVILRVQENSTDPAMQNYDGWAWGLFVNTDPHEWHIDPTGLIRENMSDPTRNDRARLLHEIRPN